MLDPMTGEIATLAFTARDNRGHAGMFDYYRSKNGHVFIGQVPGDLAVHYSGGYQPIPKDEQELARMAKVDAYRLKPLKRLVPSGSFLEIGPWIGLVAYSAARAGYSVSVLEQSRECVALLSHVGIDASQTDDPAETLRSSGRTYDVIGLWHSIEHIPRPWEMIDVAAKALNPGGILVIAAPNPASAQFRVTGRHWLHLDAPRHLHLLPIDTYRQIGERNGLVLAEITTNDELGMILDERGWKFEWQRRFRNIPGIRSLNRLPLARWSAQRHRHDELDGAGFTLIMRRP